MNSKITILSLLMFILVADVFALDINAVFDNQKKAAFPDTCELQMQTTVTMPGLASQTVDVNVISAGDNKSITTIKSSMMQMKMVQNNGRMKVTDLKTGKVLPTQNIPQQNPADLSKQMGSPSDYNTPVKEGNLWKIVPKDASKPTLYYSASMKRVVKMTTLVNGAVSESTLEYCDNTCSLPGTLREVSIETKLPQGDSSKVLLKVLNAKRHRVLPSTLFDID